MPSFRLTFLLGALTLAVPLDAAAATAITTPMTGESVASPFTVTVTYGTITECDTGGCYDTEVSSLSLFMDGAFVDSCSATTECPNGSASFEVEAAPGILSRLAARNGAPFPATSRAQAAAFRDKLAALHSRRTGAHPD